jgi:DNA polymerase mu
VTSRWLTGQALPRRIRSGKEARKLVDVGEKVAQRVGRQALSPLCLHIPELTGQIDEFLETGQIAESIEILASERYKSLRDFASVYTVGHHKARELYDQHHCRTLEDVRQHYINIAEESEEVRLKEKQRRRQRGGMTHVDIVEEWMRVKDDLDSKYVYPVIQWPDREGCNV